jgi:hypothetical protein
VDGTREAGEDQGEEGKYPHWGRSAEPGSRCSEPYLQQFLSITITAGTSCCPSTAPIWMSTVGSTNRTY